MDILIQDPIFNNKVDGRSLIDDLIHTPPGARYTLLHLNIPSGLTLTFDYRNNQVDEVIGLHDSFAHILIFSPTEKPSRNMMENGLHRLSYRPYYPEGQRMVFLASLVDPQVNIRDIYKAHNENLLRGCRAYWQRKGASALQEVVISILNSENIGDLPHCFVMGEMG